MKIKINTYKVFIKLIYLLLTFIDVSCNMQEVVKMLNLVVYNKEILIYENI